MDIANTTTAIMVLVIVGTAFIGTVGIMRAIPGLVTADRILAVAALLFGVRHKAVSDLRKRR